MVSYGISLTEFDVLISGECDARSDCKNVQTDLNLPSRQENQGRKWQDKGSFKVNKKKKEKKKKNAKKIFKPLPDNKIMNVSNLKAFADHNCGLNDEKSSPKAKNIVGKGENAGQLSQGLQNWIVWCRVNYSKVK